MKQTYKIAELLNRWESNEGKPYKGLLIDWSAYKDDPNNIGCMCAQGQTLHLIGGWSPERLLDTDQVDADRATAELLNISLAHAILLRLINDKADGAPSVVLTNPESVLGDQAQTVLAFWRHLDNLGAKDWDAAWDAARAAARDAAWHAAWPAARDAARDAAWHAAWDAARDAAWHAAWDAARAAIWDAIWDAAWAAAWAAAWDAVEVAAWACAEIQGARLLRERGKSFFFLPMFGFAEPEAIPPLPNDYGIQSSKGQA